MNDDLEQQLRAHYRALDPGPLPPAMVETVADALGSARRPLPRVGRLASVAAGLVAVGLLVAALIIGSRPGGFLAGPPSRSPSGSPTPTAPSGPQSASPTSSPTDAAVEPTPLDDAGRFGPSGVWAVQGHRLFLSSDYGTSWVERMLVPSVALDADPGDVLSNVFVLDDNHIWSASPGPGSTPNTGNGPLYDHLRVIVSRSADGGRTWRSVTVPGDWGGTKPVLTFADTRHGYLLIAGLRGAPVSTLLATSDGGATWRVVGPALVTAGEATLGATFTADGPSTLWAANQGDAGPVPRPILDVSRDGGLTWNDARLPGLVGDVFVNDTLTAPPIFRGAEGALAVWAGSKDDPPDLRFYRTTDGGSTWILAARVAQDPNGSTEAVVMDPTHFVILDPAANQIEVSSDAGASWQIEPMQGFSLSLRLWFWDETHGAALAYGSSVHAGGLIRTSDGGRTWVPVQVVGAVPSAPPASAPGP